MVRRRKALPPPRPIVERPVPAKGKSRVAALATGVPWQERVGILALKIREGVPFEPACVLAGVSWRSVQEALRREDIDAEPIAIARAEYEAELVASLVKLAREGRSHAGIAYLLERHAPTRWRQSSKLEHSGPEGAPIQTQTITLTLAEAKRIAAERDEET